MTEVYKALLALRCEWTAGVNSAYRINCRWQCPATSGTRSPIAHPMAGPATANTDIAQQQQQQQQQQQLCGAALQAAGENPRYIKICLTLYKVQHSIYLLDFQKIDGDAFSFMVSFVLGF